MSLFTKILAPTDFSENAAVAIRLAAQVASENGAELHVIHVVGHNPLRYAVREGMLTGDDTDDTISQKTRLATESKLAAEVARIDCGVAPASLKVLFGDPHHVVVTYAEQNGIDLIVMGRRGKTLADVMLGSVAERVIRHAPCPVLITKLRYV